MEAPKFKLSFGTWTPERLVKVVGGMLAVPLIFAMAPVVDAVLTGRSSWFVVFAFLLLLPILILCLAAFWGRAPLRLAAGMFAPASLLWAVVFASGPTLSIKLLSGYGLLAFALSVLAFWRLPRHERWPK